MDPLSRSHLHAPSHLGERAADSVASALGSWRMLGAMTAFVLAWVAANVLAVVHHWDPYPFILLNLVFSLQAFYAAPIILMAQNRQSTIDRARDDHEAEEVSRLFALQERQMEILENQTALAIAQHQEMTAQLAALLAMTQPWDLRR